jgi:hypothetical protein
MAESEAEENSIDAGELASFREKVVRYLTLPDEIKQAQIPIKAMKEEVAELEGEISRFMKDQDIAQCTIPDNCGGGVLVIHSSTKKPAPKKENIKKGVEAFLRKRGIEGSYDDIEKEIEVTREYVTTSTLKRVKRK